MLTSEHLRAYERAALYGGVAKITTSSPIGFHPALTRRLHPCVLSELFPRNSSQYQH
ncbi:hypothetical protein PHET_10986 [Paragonimus heterotremus]|uniref:Uncharacterized protein n=1 Tax=Paragonimus heterotremus TaxID=100268 RepID=A0A8J4WMR0_9TREM|nr:hypothetical protein PHET_10986 [Paragonimus heterotremus]